jgi:hypothetical protein
MDNACQFMSVLLKIASQELMQNEKVDIINESRYSKPTRQSGFGELPNLAKLQKGEIEIKHLLSLHSFLIF